MSLVLYSNPHSRGQIVQWMLHEVGEPFETVILDFATSMKSPEYLAINPMGKVPAIQHNGNIITETAAICAYLADAFPEKGLAPALTERADYYRWLFFASGPAEHAITNQKLGVTPTGQQQTFVGYGDYERVINALEQAVLGKQFIAADHFTAADVYVGSQLRWGLLFKTIPSRPAFERYVAGLLERPALQQTLG